MNPEEAEVYRTDRIFTLPNLMTLARVGIAGLVANKLWHGDPGATELMVAMAASDAEGSVGRAIDKAFPGKGYGCSDLGARADPIADTLGLSIVAGEALFAPRVSLLGKLAVGVVVATEAKKASWALSANKTHKAKTGEQLVIPVSKKGKQATAEKLFAVTAAVATNDLDYGPARHVAGGLALGSALLGAWHGERARRAYQRDLMGVS